MKLQTRLLKKVALTPLLLALMLCLAPVKGMAQSLPELHREQLLNGLRVLLWSRPGDANVYLKLRIHSGAAFDLAGRSGLMALLSDALFSDPTTREYFTDELGGRVEVTSDYDAINVTLTGRAAMFERIIELLRTAVVNTQLTPDVVTKLRDARIKMARELSISPALQADRAIAARLFGDYPYGRPAIGTPETLARVDRADLMQARERFLNPNNATLVVSGGVDEKRAIRALKQLLGGWRKSDTIVPATFRKPEAPDARTLIIDLPGTDAAEVRLAVRGLARSDKDIASATLLSLMARDLWLTTQPLLGKSAFFVRHEAHMLPGLFVMGASVPAAEASNMLTGAHKVLQSLSKDAVTPALLEHARNEAIAELTKQTERPESLADLWLDTDTFQLASIEDRLQQLRSVTLEDVRRTASKLFNESSMAAVALGSAEQLKPVLERAGKIEILGATVSTTPNPAPTPAKKQ
ncbi:MAG TPA: pitrilysin family protein [Pyrinomonadaceae bacterium]|jgi:zinc protease|nr:pitrilysin family protein [Pyrinomonadaceae bacterium]